MARMKENNPCGLDEELIKAKIRNITAQAEKTELKTAITKREYVRIEEVKKKWADDVQKVRAKLLGLHVKIAPELANVDARTASQVVKEAVIEALMDLAESYE